MLLIINLCFLSRKNYIYIYIYIYIGFNYNIVMFKPGYILISYRCLKWKNYNNYWRTR
ncbi:MAG: hypothetical protein N7Q72_04455 [Spiroplasma sp. Tabriz.8]|nr:hypothetical protein [Spiroplasma sp. Tabriz.8]